MQRTQLERERASAARERELMNAQIEAQRALIESQKSQMQLVVSLFERVTGAGDPVAMLKQQISLHRTFEEQSKQRNAVPEDQEEQAPPWWAQMMAQVAPAVSMWAAGKSRQEIAGALFQQMAAGMPGQPAVAPERDAVVEVAAPPAPGQSTKEKIQLKQNGRLPLFSDYALSLMERKITRGKLKSGKSRERWASVLANHLEPAFGDFYIDQIRKTDVEVWLVRIGRKVQSGEYSPNRDPPGAAHLLWRGLHAVARPRQASHPSLRSTGRWVITRPQETTDAQALRSMDCGNVSR